MNKSRKKGRIALLLLSVTMLLFACSPDNPKSQEIKRPSTESTAKPESGKSEEKKINVPDWLKDKTYSLGGNRIHFNEEGYPNTVTEADMEIIEADEDIVVFRITSGEDITIQRLTRSRENPATVTITIEGTDKSMDMTLI